MNKHSISLDQDRYANLIMSNYLDAATVKTSKILNKNTLTYDTIFTKEDVSRSDDQVENMTRELNIHYRICI